MPRPAGDRAADDGPEQARPARPGPARWLGPVRWLGAAVLLTAAVLVARSRHRELVEAYRIVTEVSRPGLLLAAACEAVSVVCFAAVQRWLLRTGGVRWGMGLTTAVVAAANAVAGALPGGAAFATAWVFRQMRRRGVEQALAAAVLAVAGALAVVSLFVLLVAGVLASGSTGPDAFVRPALGLLAAVAGTAALVLCLFRFAGSRRAVRNAAAALGKRFRRVREAETALVRLAGRARSVQPGFLPWVRPFAYSLGNWVFDGACLAAVLWALGIAVPWHGLLLSYALTQVTGSLRLTPGSLGIIEASLSALLVAHGLHPGQAIAATFLYRAISYWALQPVGWASWLGVTMGTAGVPEERRGGAGGAGQAPPR
ncbi:hypothetical protein GCM10010406_14350 [Streptomyces thermolineatus]|uniref:Integral membrane protein n=1 Tax=Streptomyces thermolineatus TaxID=44033 RepID=A0ABN3L7P4_9ACTN